MSDTSHQPNQDELDIINFRANKTYGIGRVTSILEIYKHEGETTFVSLEDKEDAKTEKEIKHGERPLSEDDDNKSIPMDKSRDYWSSKTHFLLVAAGTTVGLGNAWRFPTLAYGNGGGAFILAYMFLLVTLGIPLTYMELALGQFAQIGPAGIWKLCPLAEGTGYAMLLTNAISCVYYNVLVSYSIFYLGVSLSKELPWLKCLSWWGADHLCTEEPFVDEPCTDVSGKLCENKTKGQPAALQYWMKRVLQANPNYLNDGITGLNKQLVGCLFFAWFAVFVACMKGVKSMGKVIYMTITVTHISILVLLFVAIFQEGALDGVYYFLTPQYKRILEPDVWRVAADQVFYSLSISSGCYFTFGSYCTFRSPAHSYAVYIAGLDLFASLLFGATIFAVLGVFAANIGTPIEEVVASETNIVFVTFPQALEHLPGSTKLWSTLFFLSLASLGLDTQFALVQTIFSSIYDAFPTTRKKKVLVSALGCVILFLLGLPLVTYEGSYFLSLVDIYCGGMAVLCVITMETISIMWIYGVKTLCNDIYFMLGFQPATFWKVCWSLSPIAMSTLLHFFISVTNDMYITPDVKYPVSFTITGWMLGLLPVGIAVVVAVYNLVRYGLKHELKEVIKPHRNWGPADPELRNSRRTFDPSVFTSQLRYMSRTGKNVRTNNST